MGWKGAGLRVLRWVLWLFIAVVFLRGIGTFVWGTTSATSQNHNVEPKAVVEPAGLRSFPAIFAREYLTWEPGTAGADDRAARLGSFLDRSLDTQAGWKTGRDGFGQRATGAWVHSVKAVADGRWLVTVAVRTAILQVTTQTDAKGEKHTTTRTYPESTVYLAVPVGSSADGGLVVYDYPSPVPAPPVAAVSGPLLAGEVVADSGDRVRSLMGEFFRAYLGGSDPSYFLAPDTKLPLARSPWAFESVSKVSVVKNGSEYWALADVLTTDGLAGAHFTSRYTVRLIERDGRWYVKDLLQKGD